MPALVSVELVQALNLLNYPEILYLITSRLFPYIRTREIQKQKIRLENQILERHITHKPK